MVPPRFAAAAAPRGSQPAEATDTPASAARVRKSRRVGRSTGALRIWLIDLTSVWLGIARDLVGVKFGPAP